MEEIWKSVVGHEGFYEVSNLGRVRVSFDSINRDLKFRSGKILKLHFINNYFRVWFCAPKKKFGFVHSVVLSAFVGPRPNGLIARHLDGNSRNNCVENLTWGTSRQNINDKQIHGTQTRGSNHGTSKVVESDVIEIRRLRAEGLTLRAISERFPISCDAIHNIVRRITWTHI
jgi:hypothetical protein